MKSKLKSIVPKPVVNGFHYTESVVANIKNSKPSEKMVVIGVVGSKGKTTTANMIWSILTAEGKKTGLIGTANIRYGNKEELNKYHMTMPGALTLHRILANMFASKCKYLVMEVPSEGQTQYRHVGINFDVLVFTNVTREIMAAHNYSMEILHKHNKRVFRRLYGSKRKYIESRNIPKIIIANKDNKYYKQYYDFPADIKSTFGESKSAKFVFSNIGDTTKGIEFDINNDHYKLKMLGQINAVNAAGAVATAMELGINKASIRKGLANLPTIPGRMEVIESRKPFKVIVDYAHEQTSMTALVEGARKAIPKKSKIIILLGAEGGGRDVKKREPMGKIAGQGADYVILSNVDPYVDDPMEILEDMKKGAIKAGCKENKNLFIIADRRQGIHKALELAKKGDIVLITGKGAEQSMIIGGKSIPWDDRKVVREELKKL